jgi:hypothetical protein
VGVHAQCARLGQILWWKPEYGGKPPGYRDVNEAAENIVVMDSAILQAEAAAGMYKKPIDVPAREVHYDPAGNPHGRHRGKAAQRDVANRDGGGDGVRADDRGKSAAKLTQN